MRPHGTAGHECDAACMENAYRPSNEETLFREWFERYRREDFRAHYGDETPFRDTWGRGLEGYQREGWMARAALPVETPAPPKYERCGKPWGECGPCDVERRLQAAEEPKPCEHLRSELLSQPACLRDAQMPRLRADLPREVFSENIG